MLAKKANSLHQHMVSPIYASHKILQKSYTFPFIYFSTVAKCLLLKGEKHLNATLNQTVVNVYQSVVQPFNVISDNTLTLRTAAKNIFNYFYYDDLCTQPII